MFICCPTNAQDYKEFKTAVSLYDLYQIGDGVTLGMTLKYTTSPGSITIKIYSDFILSSLNFPNVLLFQVIGHVTPSGSVTMESVPFDNPGTQLGPIANNYPKPWQSIDIKSSAIAVKNFYLVNEWSILNPKKIFNDFLGSTIPVVIRVYDSGAELISCQIPGIGDFFANEEVSPTLRFDLNHPSRNSNSAITKEWVEIKTPPEQYDSVDIKYAAHRGFWGDDLGRGPVENTEPSIEAALPYTRIIESDVTITADDVVVVSHDYNLQRLTDYAGPNPDNTFIYDLQFDQIRDLHLRRRNFDVTDFQFVQLKDLISYMKKHNTVLTIDVKERAQRKNPITGECTAACDMTREQRDIAWAHLFVRILDVVEEENAWEYIAVKTPMTITRIKELIPREKYRSMSKILYFPVIQPGVKSYNAMTYITSWYNNAPNYLVAFETNFKDDDSPVLQPISVENIIYKNILHLVVQRAQMRPGMYPEEPMGPKGIVDRYAQWLFKDLSTDFRGDPFWLMSIPYFNTSVLTTDRPDIWQEVQRIYRK